MIDKKYQGKGYGKAAMREFINFAKKNPECKTLITSFVPGNDSAEKLYRDYGFTPNGELDGEEIVMTMEL
jgi:diamine N-acetyltransferase